MSDTEQLRVYYEEIIKHNPSNVEAVHYLAMWHLERQSFRQARKYFGHLVTLRLDDPDVWMCLSVCCTMALELDEGITALRRAAALLDNENDIRIIFCSALISEKNGAYTAAMEGYMQCLNHCAIIALEFDSRTGSNLSGSSQINIDPTTAETLKFLKAMKGEVMLRIAVLKKEMKAYDQSMEMCNSVIAENFDQKIHANAICQKGLLHEIQNDYPQAEIAYRSVLEIAPGQCIALERLGRIYLRFRETIPAAVECLFKSVQINPSSHVPWYLLGRCYMATGQYNDAFNAYDTAINLNPNDPQIWSSLGVLYYSFGQYCEALGMFSRALKLDNTLADAWYNVGALYDMCDQPEDAQEAYIRANKHGIADRFSKAGVVSNPLSNQISVGVNSASILTDLRSSSKQNSSSPHTDTREAVHLSEVGDMPMDPQNNDDSILSL